MLILAIDPEVESQPVESFDIVLYVQQNENNSQ